MKNMLVRLDLSLTAMLTSPSHLLVFCFPRNVLQWELLSGFPRD